MSERLIREALRTEFDVLSRAMSCISAFPLLATKLPHQRLAMTYAITSAGFTPLALRSTNGICFRILQSYRAEFDARSRFSHLEKQSYFFEISTGQEPLRELIAYHWDRAQLNDSDGSGPHMHIGAGVLAPKSTFALKDFHRLHIPTGFASLPRVVRFLIEELGVEPIRPNWDEILANVLD